MLQGKDWMKFFNNIEHKTDLLEMVVTFFILPEVRRRLETPLITNDKDTTLMITEHSVSTLFLCNHEEADSRLVLHATEIDHGRLYKSMIIYISFYQFCLWYEIPLKL